MEPQQNSPASTTEAPAPDSPVPDKLGEDGFGMVLFRVRMELHRLLERMLEERNFSMTFTQYRVLMSLDKSLGTTASELARCIGYDAGAMTRQVDKLVDLGYVQRTACENDRRISRLSLTEHGREAVKPIREIANDLVSRALSDLSSDEQETLNSLLKRVRSTLENMQ